jgi:DNA-directed RNA polymerase subunit M/transcription elongation factor TFIIS
MYYIRISEEDGNKLIYYCRNCGNEDEFLNKENICVSKIELKRSEQKYSHIINKYTKFDPTLPRTNSIKCPNQTCLSNSTEVDKKVEREVIYIRYDDINIKYVYLCSTCDTLWRTNEIK